MNAADNCALTDRPRLIRAGEVMRLTGWSRSYVRKLVVCGVLREVRHARHLHPWYALTEVEQLIEPQT